MIRTNASMHRSKIRYNVLILSFIVYLIFLIWASLFKFSLMKYIDPQVNLLNVSFLERLQHAFTFNSSVNRLTINSIFNLILFIPLGLYLPLLCRKTNYFRDFIIGLFVALGFEFLQGFTRLGAMDIIDVIFNLVGLLIGSLIYALIRPHVTKNMINIIQIIVLIIFIPITCYGIYTIVVNWEGFAPFFDFAKYPIIWK